MVTFEYDDTQLPGDEADLGLMHYTGGNWLFIGGTVNPSANSITVSAPSFSPFILALAPAVQHTITATAGLHGAISPAGTVSVTDGDDQAFTIAASNLYRIASVTTNDADAGVAVDNATTNYVYTWSNVVSDGMIEARFTARVTSHDVPYPWLDSYYPGTNDFEAADGSDTDQDTMYAWQEWIADTSPLDGTNFFHVDSISMTGTVVSVDAAPGTTGRVYTLNHHATPGAAPSVVSSNSGSVGTVTLTDTNAALQGFYSAEVQFATE